MKSRFSNFILANIPTFLALSSIVLTGCYLFPNSGEVQKVELNSIDHINKIKVGGGGTVILGESTQFSMKPEALLEKAEKLLLERRYASAKNLLEKYPDLTLEILRKPPVQKEATLLFASQVYDQMFLQRGKTGWYTLYKHRSQNPILYQRYHQDRSILVNALKNGNFEQAANLGLNAPKGTPGEMINIDMLSLKALAGLLVGNNSAAIKAYEEGIQLCENYDPYQASHLRLLQSECYRRKKENDKADEAWLNAVTLANQAFQEKPAPDPIFWERSILLKDKDLSWPEEILANNNANLANPLSGKILGDVDSREDSYVWEHIGYWYLRRNETQPALVAFRKSLNLEQDTVFVQRLQIAQCKAFVQLHQFSAAAPTLLKLAQNQDPYVASSALAILGVIDLKRNQVYRGLGLILKAMDNNPDIAWTERNDVITDLGLAYLVAGDEQKGIQYLREAQSHFEAKNQVTKLLRSLKNEQKYWDKVGKSQNSEKVKSQIKKLENSVVSDYVF